MRACVRACMHACAKRAWSMDAIPYSYCTPALMRTCALLTRARPDTQQRVCGALVRALGVVLLSGWQYLIDLVNALDRGEARRQKKAPQDAEVEANAMMVKCVHLSTKDHAHHLHLRDRQNGILYVSMLPVPPVFPPPFTISAAETTGLLALLPVTVILALACDGVV